MKNLRKIAFYSIFPILIICTVEGIIFYSDMDLSTLGMVIAVLDNLIKVFLARPAITSLQALKDLNGNDSLFVYMIANTYAILAFLAPLMAATAVIVGFRAYLHDFRNSISLSLKKKIFVIGDDAMAASIALRYAHDYHVFYFMPSGTKDEDRIPLLRKGVQALAVDYKDIASYCREYRAEKADFTFFSFGSWFDNYKTVSAHLEYLISEAKTEALPVSFIDAPAVFSDMFYRIYKGYCINNSKPETTLLPSFLNISMLNLQNYFKTAKLFCRSEEHHIVLMGFGEYGKALLRCLTVYFEKNGLSGTIEVFDRNVEFGFNDIMYSSETTAEIMSRYTRIEPPEENAKLTVQYQSAASRIQINFYSADFLELSFSRITNIIENKHRVTDYFVCLSDLTTSFECYRMFTQLGLEKKSKIYFRVSNDMKNSFSALLASTPEISALPDGLPDIDLLSIAVSKEEK